MQKNYSNNLSQPQQVPDQQAQLSNQQQIEVFSSQQYNQRNIGNAPTINMLQKEQQNNNNLLNNQANNSNNIQIIEYSGNQQVQYPSQLTQQLYHNQQQVQFMCPQQMQQEQIVQRQQYQPILQQQQIQLPQAQQFQQMQMPQQIQQKPRKTQQSKKNQQVLSKKKDVQNKPKKPSKAISQVQVLLPQSHHLKVSHSKPKYQLNMHSQIQNYQVQNQLLQLQIETFNDDEQIEEKQFVKSINNKQTIDLAQILKFEVKSTTKSFKLSSTKSQKIPVMVSVNTKGEEVKKEFSLDNRPSIDLICVIDRSGSMSGQKIKLVQDTLLLLMDLLNEKDRLSLVQFDHIAQRLTPLKKISKKNIPYFAQQISNINAGGGTSIVQGMNQALKQLKEKKYKNQVNSIFLLSDGLDSSAQSQVQKLIQQYNIQDVFTIHTFGYGADHDPELMKSISSYKDGNFYYIEKYDQVQGMFIDALGGLFSVIGKNVLMEMAMNRENKNFADVTICKVYGPLIKEVKKNCNYSVNLQQLIVGSSKDFMLEMLIPPISVKIDDFQRNTVLLKASISVDQLEENQPPVKKEAGLEMTIYNENEQIPDQMSDENVQANLIRVQAAEVMEQSYKLAQQGQFAQAQSQLQQMNNLIQNSSSKICNNTLLIQLDLQKQQQLCNQATFTQYLQTSMNQQQAHMNQRSYQAQCPSNIHLQQINYSNHLQQQLGNMMNQQKPQNSNKK